MVKPSLLVLALAVACQSRDAPPRVETGGSAAPRPIASDAGSGSAVAEPDLPEVDKQPKRDEPEPVDPGKQLVELGAVPAWQAVVDRGLYLERRGQKGVVYGTLGDPISAGSGSAVEETPYTWLVDDTEGNGALAIRAKLPSPSPIPVKAGDRAALAGAWAVDDAHRWYWHVTAVTSLPPATPSKLKDEPSLPGHAIANGELPAGVRPISKADDDALVYFTLAGPPPVLDGDGWPVADELGSPVVAILNLPGEHASYGAQDLRTPDERWTLKRGHTYWLRVGVVHKHGPDRPMTMTARTEPRDALH